MTDTELAQAADETHGLRDDLEHARSIAVRLQQDADEGLRYVREAKEELTAGRRHNALSALIEAERVLTGDDQKEDE